MPMGELRDNARDHGEDAHANAECNRQLVGTEALWPLLGGGRRVRAHNEYNASGQGLSSPDPYRVSGKFSAAMAGGEKDQP